MEEYIINDSLAADDFQSLLDDLSESEKPSVEGQLVTVPGIGIFEFTDKYRYFLDRLLIVGPVDKKYIIVESDEERASMEQHIRSHDLISFDTETTGLNVRKSRVIGFSVCGKVGVAFYYPLYQWLEDSLQPIKDNIDKCTFYLEMLKEKKLMMWNGSFDIRVVKNDLGIDLTSSLYAEGMLLKHMVQEEGPFGLKESGIEIQQFIGLDVEEAANKEQIALKENVAKNGGETKKTNYEMYKADLEVLGIYGASDADLNLRICNYYLGRVIEEGLEDFFFNQETMFLYRESTVVMEDSGVCMDMPLLRRSKVEIEEDITMLIDKVVSSLRNTEEFAEWVVEAATKVFPPKPTGNFAQEIVRQYELDLPTTPAGKYSTSAKFVKKLPDSLAKSFLLREDEDFSLLNLDSISINLWKEKNGRLINISSKKQMGELVFGKMGVKPLSKTEKGLPQFNATLIEHLADDGDGYDWAKHLKDYNRLIKIRGTYIDRFLDREEGGKYYFSYKQHGTISGRYGSDAQQLPRPMEVGQDSDIVLKYSNRIRKFFISGEDRVFIDADYESLEPHVFAHVSGDQRLIDIFDKGHDFYSTIAIATEGLEGFSADKKADNYLGKLDKQKRQMAKAYSLGIAYGMSAYALGKTLDIDTDEAQELIDGYMAAYPDLKKWIDKSRQTVQDHGIIRTESGRIRHLPEAKRLYSIHKNRLLDFKYRARISKKFGKEEVYTMYKDYKNGMNNSVNVQIQGLSSNIVNRAMIAINRKLIELEIDGYCCAQFHDQIVCNVPEKDSELCREIVQDIMENTTKLSLKLKAPAEVGRNWYEAH